MSANWIVDGERHRLHCGKLKATCSPAACTKMWLWRVDVDEGFGTFGAGTISTLEKAKGACERALKSLRYEISKGLGE